MVRERPLSVEVQGAGLYLPRRETAHDVASIIADAYRRSPRLARSRASVFDVCAPFLKPINAILLLAACLCAASRRENKVIARKGAVASR
jgi:hypothetical protein